MREIPYGKIYKPCVGYPSTLEDKHITHDFSLMQHVWHIARLDKNRL
jgi:hypothetical protein